MPTTLRLLTNLITIVRYLSWTPQRSSYFASAGFSVRDRRVESSRPQPLRSATTAPPFATADLFSAAALTFSAAALTFSAAADPTPRVRGTLRLAPTADLIRPFRRRNPPNADFSFRPTDFLVQDYRLFGDPYRLFLLRLRGHSDESYGPRSARFPNFFRYRVNQTSRSSPCPPALSRRQMRIFGIITADDACLSR